MLFRPASVLALLFAAASVSAAAVQMRDTIQATCTPPVDPGTGLVFTGCAVAFSDADAANATAIAIIADYFGKGRMGCNRILNAVAPLVGHITATGCDHPGIDSQTKVVPGFAVNTAQFDPVCGPGDKC